MVRDLPFLSLMVFCLLLSCSSSQARPFTVETRLDVGAGPNASAVALGGRMLVVCNSDSEDLARIDLATGELLAPVPLARCPMAVTLSADGRLAYVACFYGKTVDVVDVEAGRRLASVPLDRNPRDLARLGDRILVAAYYAGEILALDAATFAMVGRLVVDPCPAQVLAHPDGERAYVLNTGRDALYEVRCHPLRLAASVDEAFGYQGCWEMCLSRDGATLCVSQWNGDRVAVLSTAPLAIRGFVATGGHGPCSVDLDHRGRILAVAMSEDDRVALIDVEALERRALLDVGRFPFSDLRITPDGRHALVTEDQTACIAVVDLEALALADTLWVGPIPRHFAFGPGGRIYLSCTGNGTLAVLAPTGRRGRAFDVLHHD